MDFKTYLKNSASDINEELNSLLSALENDVNLTTSQLSHTIELFTDRIYGGKVLRGTLVKLGYELNGKKNSDEILKAAAALEVLHTSFLIHDDIIDQSETRRNKPSIYKALGGNHHGISQAICLGDLGLFLTIKTLNQTDFDDKLKNKAIEILIKSATDTILGEMLDVELADRDHAKNESDVLNIHKLKTASYSFIAPLSIGAVFGGSDNNVLDNIHTFGENLGIAFQIQDDILGVFGDETELGKSTHSDIEEGKNTLLITYALKNSNSGQKEILKRYYGAGEIRDEDYQKVLNVFIETKSLEYSKTMADKYMKIAKESIILISQDKGVRQLLNQLSDLVVDRAK